MTARELLHRLDQVVTMARLLGDQLEQDQAQLGTAEHPPASRASTAARAPGPLRSERSAGAEGPTRTEGSTGTERTAMSAPAWPGPYPGLGGLLPRVAGIIVVVAVKVHVADL